MSPFFYNPNLDFFTFFIFFLQTVSDSLHLHSLVLKIKLLLLSGGNDRLEAQKLADQSYGISDTLDSWLDCLEQTETFTNLINTNSELDRRCLSPVYQW